MQSVIQILDCSQILFYFSNDEVPKKKKRNGGVKCAINQTKPYPLLFMSSTMQPTIIVDADAIFKK